ncbi:MAG: UbiD family decarboxylase [Syntrophorhabdales bacterium]|jgi:2,5-furandicarboxylate decarboxylase 1
MNQQIDEGRRAFFRTASFGGAALVACLYGGGHEAAAFGPGVIRQDEVPAGYRSGEFRDFLRLLNKRGEIVHVKKRVDRKYEIGGYLWAYEQRGKAVRFEQVKGSTMPVIGGLYQNWKRIGLSLGQTGTFGQKEMYALFQSAVAHALPPTKVSTGPVKEIILKGEGIDMGKLPVPTLFEGDGGPYITAGAGICRNPENGLYNIGIYRMQVVGKDRILVWAFPGSDLNAIYKAYEGRGQELDFAVAIGVDPAFFATAVSKVPTDVDEMAVAGGLRGRPIKVVQGETTDLLIPAYAEVVIEGKINPKERITDGPFADHGGIYKGGSSPVLKVSSVLQRRDAVFHVILAGDSEEHCTASEILACFWGQNILDDLQAKFPSVRDLHLSWHGGTKKWAVVSVAGKQSENEPKAIIDEIFNLATKRYTMLPVSSYLRSAILVDSDVDIYNVKDIIWAVGTRLADCTVIGEEKAKGYELRLGLDATKRLGVPESAYRRTKVMPVKL